MKKIILGVILFISVIGFSFAQYGPSQEQINEMMKQYMPANIPSMPSGFDMSSMMNGSGIPGGIDPSQMQQKGMQQGLAQMKKGIMTFKNSMDRVKQQIKGFEDKGCTPSDSLNQAMIKVDEIVNIINNAQDMDSAQKAFDMIDEVTKAVETELPKCAIMTQLPNLIQRAQNEYDKLVTQFGKVKNTTNVEVDISQALSELQSKIDELGNVLKTIKSKALDYNLIINIIGYAYKEQ